MYLLYASKEVLILRINFVIVIVINAVYIVPILLLGDLTLEQVTSQI